MWPEASHAACACKLDVPPQHLTDSPAHAQMRQVLTGVLGFMTYKMALLGVAAVPSSPAQRATEGNRLT